ncbi:proline-rich receptor-like protein kinase PERK2 [Manihot esculenta]|uniref:proline-rich receptor-like protein kinase PERK2 n=1 Tax=Manihot esculenta TaxID=3983 RepID=UPI001CC687A6|nr:proline-rich receptor-like protein kinase PERK2 [Manihot esculenta]
MYQMVSCINSCINQPLNSRPTMEKIRLVLEGKSPPEELYDHELQWSIIHRDDESSSYFEEIDQIEESGPLHEKNYKGIRPKPNSFSELAVANYKGGLKPYSFSELAKATDQFSLQRQFGQGGFGQAFMASLDGKIRVVKKLNNFPDVQSEGDFERVIMVLNGVRHKNLVKLVGYCIEGANRLLISKFFPNMSLRYQLYRKGNALDWKKRMNIAIGSARGLEYLHEYSKLKIIHLFIKSDNILLDNDFNPKVR